MALLILAVGLARVYWGGKGEAYYAANGWFWAKMAAFGLAGLLSIAPTMAFLRWRKRVKANPNALPSPAEIAGVRRFLVLEFLLLLLVPAFAAVMARHTTAS